MDGVSAAASVIALVEISVKILSLTVEYSTQVKSAKEDIARFRLELDAFIKLLRSLHELAQNPEAKKLVTFKSLAQSIQQCKLDLENLYERLEPGKSRKAMSRYGIRALKWPFESKELHNLIDRLERYKSTFSTTLNADQTALILDSGVKLDLAEQDRCLSKLSYAAGANFDSNERENEPYCLPNTRVEILSQIMEWSANPSHKRIFWLNGMAGTGKSTIARTIARTLTEQKRLAANFFFSRGRGDLTHAGKLLSTIAIQLAATSLTLKRYICEAIAEHDNIGRQSMDDQWKKLICQPISKLQGDLQPPLVLVFVFDALDECGRQEDIRKLLQLLAETKLSVQFRALVTSRPEIPIRLGFRAISGNMHEDFVLHNIAPPVIQHDIATFLRHEMKAIRDDHLLPSDWPGEDQLQLLLEKSSGLFIYAATVCRFIHDPRWLPGERLNIVLQGNSNDHSPEQRLDDIYIQILESSVFGDCNKHERELLSQRFQKIVGLIIILSDSLSIFALKSLSPALSEKIDVTLKPLKSLLDIPDDQNIPVRLLHPSFRDFLINNERCRATHFWIDQRNAHHDVAEQCLDLMAKTLGKNICQLETPGTSRREIDDTRLNQFLPSHVQYACQYWVGHLQKGIMNAHKMTRVYEFLRTHFLHWLEALSLMGKTSEAVLLISLLELIPEFQTNAGLLAFVKDAKRFILEFRYVVETKPLQLYSSALSFSPEASLVKRCFADQMPGWIEKVAKVQKNWTPSLQVLEGHSDGVCSIVFSFDGQLLASGSADATVKLWDPVTGDLRGTLEGHLNGVRGIAFSPDNQLLASASADMTIKLWDTATGDLRSTLEGHLDEVNAVVFSPDGQLLASGSADYTVRLWDPATGASRGTLEGHSNWVRGVVFSPDGQLLASGSDDDTVRLWDPATGASRGTLEGHSNWVRGVVFSPDGQLLASGSDDNTVRLWDPATGDSQSTLEGHSGWVRVVAFSPDGQLLASGSDDNTVRLWDPATGASRGTLEGHSDRVRGVAFSPDGQLLASGSNDKTVRLWDPAAGGFESTLEGHLDKVNAVVFSSDGKLLASASNDETVRLCDPATGDLRGTLKGHSDLVLAAVFSPDGQLLASGSADRTVRIWNPATGASRGTLEGHSDWVRGVAFSPDGKLLASASDDHTVRIWDPVTGDSWGKLEGHSEWVFLAVFSPDGQVLASGSMDKTVRLWDPATGDLQGTLKGHSKRIKAIVFSPDSQLLASASDDDTVRLWLVKKKTLLQHIEHTFCGNMYFGGDGMSQLILDGRLVGVPSASSTASQASADAFYSLSVDKQWVTWKNRNVLWLPFNYRPSAYAMKDNMHALGCSSGRVTTLSFSSTVTPF